MILLICASLSEAVMILFPLLQGSGKPKTINKQKALSKNGP